MRKPLWVFTGVLLAGCGSIHNLSPETAASRISSYDSYKEEACEIMEIYVNRYEAFNWALATPIESLPPEEIKHIAAVFDHRPQVTCRVKAGKFFYDIDGRSFADIARVLAPLQAMYERLGAGEALTRCDDCELPDVAVGNGFLVNYFRRPPFPALRKQHAELFMQHCSDPARMTGGDTAAGHEGHGGKPGYTNPLHELHGGCEAAWRQALNAMSARCSRFGFTHYLVCPTGVWSTHSDLARPFSAYPGYTRSNPFASGFALELTDGRVDVYWLHAEDALSHETVSLKKNQKIEIDDFDANRKSDFNAGELIVLTGKDGFGRRTSVTHFNAGVDAKELRKRSAEVLDTWERLPLDAIERMLMTTEYRNAILLERAAKLSAQWLEDAQAEQRALLEQVQVFWHALLWNTLDPQERIDRAFWDELRARTLPQDYAARQRALTRMNNQNEGQELHEACRQMRTDMQQVIDDLKSLVGGSELASEEVGAAWDRYLKKSIPVAEATAALAVAEKNAKSVEAFLDGVCL